MAISSIFQEMMKPSISKTLYAAVSFLGVLCFLKQSENKEEENISIPESGNFGIVIDGHFKKYKESLDQYKKESLLKELEENNLIIGNNDGDKNINGYSLEEKAKICFVRERKRLQNKYGVDKEVSSYAKYSKEEEIELLKKLLELVQRAPSSSEKYEDLGLIYGFIRFNQAMESFDTPKNSPVIPTHMTDAKIWGVSLFAGFTAYSVASYFRK